MTTADATKAPGTTTDLTGTFTEKAKLVSAEVYPVKTLEQAFAKAVEIVASRV